MKIAFVSQPWEYPLRDFQLGSIPTWTYEVAVRLAEKHDVTVYSRRGLSGKPVLSDRRVRYRNFFAPAFIKVINLFSKFDDVKRPLFASRLYNLMYLTQVAIDLKRQQCDIVHIHNFSPFVPLVRALNPQIKIVLHMHCEWLTQLDTAIVEQRLRHVDLVVSCSDYITKKIRAKFPQFAHRCQTIYNGVNIEHFTPQSDRVKPSERQKRLLFVGRVSPEKGVHLLLEAWQKVVSYFPDVELEIVGPEAIAPLEYIVALSDEAKVQELARFYPASYLAQLQQMIPAAVASQVKFTGFVPHSQLPARYLDADVLINPSLSEAFGMSLVEAMAMEVPTIAARVGGMPEVIAVGQTGLLFEANDVSGLAAAIVHLLSNSELRQTMGKAGRQRASNFFSWDRIAENTVGQYEKICDRAATMTPYPVNQP